jgi:hypothetical protein
MEMSQQNPLYNYHALIKMLKENHKADCPVEYQTETKFNTTCIKQLSIVT